MGTTSTADGIVVEESGAKKTDVLELIKQARKLVETSKKIPLTNCALVDRDSLINLLEEIRLALPSNVKLASQVLHRRERIINEALVEARRILAANAEDLEATAQQHNLVTLAEKKAADILKQAENQVRLMMADATKQITVPKENTTHVFSRMMNGFWQFIRRLLHREKN